MSFKLKINLSKTIMSSVGFLILTSTIGCTNQKSLPKVDAVGNTVPSLPSVKSSNLQTCPSSVTAKGKPYGIIELNWQNYAPNTNSYFTFVVVPHATGGLATKSITDTTDKGSYTLEGYPAGSYYVYYELIPASPNYPPCVGVESKITFV